MREEGRGDEIPLLRDGDERRGSADRLQMQGLHLEGSARQAPQMRRLSRGSVEVQTLHLQPICGTPTLVPVPKNLNLNLRPQPFFSGILPVVKYCSTSSSVRPFVSGRKNAAVMK